MRGLAGPAGAWVWAQALAGRTSLEPCGIQATPHSGGTDGGPGRERPPPPPSPPLRSSPTAGPPPCLSPPPPNHPFILKPPYAPAGAQEASPSGRSGGGDDERESFSEWQSGRSGGSAGGGAGVGETPRSIAETSGSGSTLAFMDMRPSADTPLPSHHSLEDGSKAHGERQPA